MPCFLLMGNESATKMRESCISWASSLYLKALVAALLVMLLAGQVQCEEHLSGQEFAGTKVNSADDGGMYTMDNLVNDQHSYFQANLALQEHKDIIAIGQAFRGFDEMLLSEQEALSKEEYDQSTLDDDALEMDEDDEQHLAEAEEAFENDFFQLSQGYNKTANEQLINEPNHQVHVNKMDGKKQWDSDGLITDQEDIAVQDSIGKFFDSTNLGKSFQNVIKKIFSGKSLSGKSHCDTVVKLLGKLRKRGSIRTKNSVTTFRASSGTGVDLSSFIPLSISKRLRIKTIELDCSNYYLTIQTLPTTKWTIIPKYMSIQGVTVSLRISLKSPKTTLYVTTSGTWRLGSLNIAVRADYDHAKGTTSIVAQPQSGTSLSSFVKGITGLSLPISPSVKVSFKFEGHIYSTGAVFIQLSSDKGRNKFYAIYRKENKFAKPVKVIAVEVKQLKLSSLLQRVTGLDISRVPFFGKLTLPNIGLIHSTGVMTIEGSKLFKNSQLLSTTKGKISRGINAYIKLPFHKEPLIATYRDGVFVITTSNKKLRFDKMINYLLVGGSNRQIPFSIKPLQQIFKLNIENMIVSKKFVTIVVTFPKPVVFFEKFLHLSNVKAKVRVSKSKPRVSVKIAGNIHLAGATFKTQLAQNHQKKYVLTANGDRLSFKRLLQTFHAAILPKALHRFFKKIPFFNIIILRPRISYVFGARPLQIHIGGNPVVSGYRIVNMDVLLVKMHGKIKAALGVQLGSINLADTLTRITGFNFRKFPLLNQNINSAVILSPITSQNVHFAVGKLASSAIKKGISFKAPTKFPKKCGSDKFCKFAGTLVGHQTVLSLQVSIESTTFYSVTASLRNLRLSKGLILANAGLEIVGGASSQIGLVGEVKLRKPPVTFAAKIYAGSKGLTLQLSMSNCWHGAFGAKWLDICNLLGAVDFAPPTGITGFVYGGQIHLGYKSTGHQIQAKGYIGTSLINPVENFYYVKFSRITMGSLLKAFKIKWRLPRPLAESGFPHGFLNSFSVLGKSLPEVDLKISAGYRIKGTLNILGLQGSADATINLPKLIDIKVGLSPIRIGRLLAMYASSSDRKKGPFLMVKVQALPRFIVHLEASGYVKVLGISIEARLKISNTQYEYFIRGKVLHLFEASMHITARYGNIRKAHFRVRGEFKLDLFRGIKRIVQNLFRGVSDVAKKALGAAKRVYRKILNFWKRAKNAVGRAWRKLTRIRRWIVVAELMASCPNKSCQRAIVQGWFRKKIRRVSRFVKRKVRKVTRHVKRVIKKGHNFIKKKAKQLYSWAKRALNKARAVVRRYASKLKFAKKAIDWVKKKFKSGLKIFNYIRKHGLGGIINIRRLWFDVSLESASLGKFAGGIDLQFFGRHRLKLNVSFDLRKIASLAKQLFRKLLRKIKRVFG